VEDDFASRRPTVHTSIEMTTPLTWGS
jgi:hypothetical protein